MSPSPSELASPPRAAPERARRRTVIIRCMDLQPRAAWMLLHPVIIRCMNLECETTASASEAVFFEEFLARQPCKRVSGIMA